MAKDEASDDQSGLRDVEITIVVVPGRIRAMLATLLANPRIRAVLLSGGLIAAVVAAAIIVLGSGNGRAGRSLRSDALAMQFGLRFNCTHRTVVTSDGAYARFDLDHAGPCGLFGNQVTVVFHRVHGVWVRAFEGSSWKCPTSRLPQSVAIKLQLCR